MTTTKSFTTWQRAAALAVEGACLLPYIVAGLLYLLRAIQNTPPSLIDDYRSYLLLTASALFYGAVCAPLRLWRAAWYMRLCRTPATLPSLRPPRHWLWAMHWRWALWWRRALALLLAGAPTALLWGYGSVLSQRGNGAQPLLWLLLGFAALLGGAITAAVWQCRYILAPYYVLDDYPADAAMALSVKAMRGHIADYLTFLAGEIPRLLLCVAIIPAVWIIPTFRRRHTALLVGWM